MPVSRATARIVAVVVDQPAVPKARERGENLAPREIAGAAEDDERARPVDRSLLHPLLSLSGLYALQSAGRPAFVAIVCPWLACLRLTLSAVVRFPFPIPTSS